MTPEQEERRPGQCTWVRASDGAWCVLDSGHDDGPNATRHENAAGEKFPPPPWRILRGQIFTAA